MPVLAAVLEIGLPADAKITVVGSDGERVVPGTVIARVTSKTIPLLTIERTSLNVVSRLCGVATLTRQWVDAVASSAAKIRDTRKTTPGLRSLEKYAVRCGGGVNHRMGLHDAVLIKDNHVVAAGGVGAALDAVHRRYDITPGKAKTGFAVQVEVDSFAQLDEALDHGATQVLLDNMTPDEMTEAVRRVRARNADVLVEASGGLVLENAARVAATGVDFLAVGALTHSAPILDIALDFH
jgi:nicotinate-nucleotide pyrophosphorylase (carboxylating)